MKQCFRFQSSLRFLALVVAGLVATTATAYADTMYSFTLTPTIKAGQGSVGGTGTVSFSTPIPLTGSFDANQNGTITANTTKITALSVQLTNGLVFVLNQASGTDIGFFNDKLTNFSYYANSMNPQLAITPTTYQFTSDGNYSGPTYSTGTLTFNVNPVVATTPEPSSLLLLGTGFVALAGAARRRFLAV